MKTLCSVVLATLLSSCATSSSPLANFELTQTSEFTPELRTTFRIPREKLASTMATLANQKEFQIAYFPELERAVNITTYGATTTSRSDSDLLLALLKTGLAVDFIHNHSDRELDPDAVLLGRPLYWVAPSIEDLGQYLGIGPQGSKLRYRIASKYGLLTMSTDEATFKDVNNHFFYRTLEYEAEHLQLALTDKSADDLKKWAENYRGMFTLSFEPVLPQ